MHYLHGDALKVIAEKIGTSELAVAGYLKRGIKVLRDKIPRVLTDES